MHSPSSFETAKECHFKILEQKFCGKRTSKEKLKLTKNLF